MSMQKIVVRAVSAESALLNEAATIPRVNKISTVFPNCPVAANIGNSSSPEVGSGVPVRRANIDNSTPNPRNSRLTGTKANP